MKHKGSANLTSTTLSSRSSSPAKTMRATWAGDVSDGGVAPGPRWVLRHRARAWGTNLERRLNRWERAQLVREWRHAYAVLALAEHLPHLERVALTVMPYVKSRRSIPDTGSCAPAAKAAIDGLVDAHVLDDDGPAIVRSITFVAPIVAGFDALDLVVLDITDPPREPARMVA